MKQSTPKGGSSKKAELFEVKTPKFRAAFPEVFRPKAFSLDGDAADKPKKYSIVMLFDKKTDLKEMKQAAMKAVVSYFGEKYKDPKKWPEGFKWPFRDGDKRGEELDGYAGHFYVAASSLYRPGIVRNDSARSEIREEDGEFYAGCYARALLAAQAFDVGVNKGVKFYLQGLQKLGDGEAFGGKGKDLTEEFDYVEDEDTSDDTGDGMPEESDGEEDSDFDKDF